MGRRLVHTMVDKDTTIYNVEKYFKYGKILYDLSKII